MTQEFDAATLPLHGLRLIEASAGTGKTYSLAGLYLRLIIEQHASIRDILVMTFTRAATQELRDRIRSRLTAAARIARAPEQANTDKPEDRFTLQILHNHGQNDAEDATATARRLTAAANRMDEATIVTIHGFAQRAATENAFENALAFDRGDNVDDAEIQRQLTTDYWREHVFATNASADLLAAWPTPDALYDTIAPVLRRSDAALAGLDRQRLSQLRAELATTWPQTAQPLTAALMAALADGALLKTQPLYQALAAEVDLEATLDALDQRIQQALNAGSIPLLPAWLTLLAAPAPHFKKAAKHQAQAQQLAALPAVATLAELQPLAWLTAADAAINTVRECAERHKRQHRQYSYDDLIRGLYDGLHAANTGAALADALHARWPYALVDEFQDTDALQYASLRRIYLETPREHGALLLIGDPKQAIYAFRGGDVFTYLEAARAAGDARYTLTTNYRSTQTVLDGIEALYRVPVVDPFLVEDIDFPSVEAGREPGDKRLITTAGEHAALTFWQLHGGETVHKNGNVRNPKKDLDRDRLLARTVTGISRLLDGHSVWWQHADDSREAIVARDIAVLVNSHKQATAVQVALAQHGIMSVCQHNDSVFATTEADDLRRILRALAAPDDARAVRAAQATTLIGKQLSDLIELATDDHALQQAIEHCHGLHETWQRRGVLTALEQLFMQAAPRLLGLTDGERRMSNYLQLGELLAAAETECFGMTSVVRWLDQHIEAVAANGNKAVDDVSQLRLESDDADLVRISTVHAAKGLEYPIVFMPFAQWLGAPNSKYPPDAAPLMFHAAAGQAAIDLVGSDIDHQVQAVIEAQSEALRLLYVALTRAKQALFIGWRSPDSYNRSAALDHLLHRDGAGDEAPLVTLAQQQPDAIALEEFHLDDAEPAASYHTPQAADTLTAARTDLPTARPRWSTYSFSRLAHAAPATVADAQPDALPEPGAEDEPTHDPSPAWPGTTTHAATDSSALPALDERLSGTRFGTAVHDILELALSDPEFTAWPAPDQPGTDAHLQCVAERLRTHGLLDDNDDDPRVHDTAALVARTLHTPLPDIGTLAQLDRNHLRTEMGFMLRLGGNTLGALTEHLQQAGYLAAALGGQPMQTLYGLMQGFIDVVIEHDNRYYILDYKTNRLGDSRADYEADSLGRAMTRSHYDLQYLIYTVALHRHLRDSLGAAYDPATHLGGVHYLFVRAMDGQTTSGVFSDRPDPTLIATLDALFDAREAA